ncbi:hypothetical protein ACFC4G_45355 [Streptomyces sp. NPDC056002]
MDETRELSEDELNELLSDDDRDTAQESDEDEYEYEYEWGR